MICDLELHAIAIKHCFDMGQPHTVFFNDRPVINSHWLPIFRKCFKLTKSQKNIHMTYSFLELLIFFWLLLVGIHCLEFISQYIKEISKVNESLK